ncbi:MAG: S1 RNA-binding domain-containing protein [Phycisphaerae bacterium]|nr:S1 RNA-binding domain-containing protein [Phycisphaerae bacterium]
MTMEPTPDSGQNEVESEVNAAPNEKPALEAAPAPPPEIAETPPDASANKTTLQSESMSTPAVSGDGPSLEPAPVSPSPPRPPTAAEIAASITHTEDVDLDKAVEEALTGISEADIAGATVELPKSEEPTAGAIVTGRIANVGSKDVLIDLGSKSFASMLLAELDKDEECAVGDSIEVMITGEDNRGGLLTASRRKAKQAGVLRDMKVGAMVEGHVTGMNKGGLEVVIEGLRAFIPASQVDLRFMKDISQLIGETIRAEVTKFELDDEHPNIVLSRRRWLLREEAERKEQLFTELEAGQTHRGKVRSVTDYGAFVDIGGVDGLLHIRDMSWGHVTKAEDVVSVGGEIDVKVLKVDRKRKKVSLSLKQTIGNPWDTAAEKYQPGTKLQGRVVRMATFGAFIELEPGVDGLLPVSEMSWTRRVRHPSEIVKEGDVVEVSVLHFDDEKKRISLSLKSLSEDPWTDVEEKYGVGSTIKGKVVRTTDFGAFVSLEDGIDGLVHISEIAEERIRAVTDKVNPGDEVEVRVLGVDTEAKKISLSMRQPPAEPSSEDIAKATAERAAVAKKKPSKPKRGGITFGWDEGLGSLDPSKFAR